MLLVMPSTEGLYEAIFTRKSVGEFAPEPLPADVLEDLATYLQAIDQMPGGGVRLELAGPEAVTDSSAPHYILGWCRSDDTAHINLGYTLQAADLYIRSLGLGGHWKAMPRLKSQPSQSPDGLNYSLLLAFGTPAEPMRGGEADFKRLPIEAVSNIDNAVARAARLAPSPINIQPWTLQFEDTAIRARHTPRGALRLITGRAGKISLGIVTRHLMVALQHQGIPVSGLEVDASGKRPVVVVHLG
jgi:nitroreductase